MEDTILDFIREKYLYIVPALWIVGAFLKRTPNVPDWTIPWALLGLGVVGAVSIGGVNPEVIVQGVLASGAAVFTHQLLKQSTKKEDK